MKTLTISLTEEQAALVEQAVADGRYASDSEIVAEALRLLQQREAWKAEETEWLRREIQAGLDSGEPVDLDFDELLAELNAEYEKRA